MSNQDFDFFFGRWNVRNRKLREALAGSGEWVEFDASIEVRRVWGGAANFDEYVAPETPWGPIYGATFRLYNAATGQWTIYWANRKKGVLDPPMTGEWKDGKGEFYDQELFRDRMIYVRFLWSHEGENRARWEQAFSDDGGRNWETNWIMEMERAS